LASDKNEQLFDELTKEENIAKTMEWYAGIDQEKAYQRIKKRIAFTPQRRKTISFTFISVAASVLLIVGIAAFFFWQKNQHGGTHQLPVALSQDMPPGSNKAILTLADGRKIVLDSTAPKTVSDGMIKIDAGIISYDTLGATPPKENLLTVPRGGQFMVELPDGTKVWLNAESSLRYTTSFIGNERRVALTGEGYFEVTKNKEKPFIVESSGSTIKVLGTKFNVNSYKDEEVFTTTLVEGSVQITKGTISEILKPGQQARVTESKIDVAEVDLSEATAWKNGEFVFRNTPVHTIVRQLARWYDLDVEYRDPVEKHLNATIKRDVPLSKLLHYLQETGDVHFKIEGKKLIVMK
jgi:transmembrane sensor